MLANQIDIDKLLEHIVSVVFEKSDRTIDEKRDMIIRAFYDLYNEAYQALVAADADIAFHEKAISTDKTTHRYQIFKSFIENCVIDCAMWGLGSGKIRFTPYQALYDYIYGNQKLSLSRGKVLKEYMELELPEVFERKNRK